MPSSEGVFVRKCVTSCIPYKLGLLVSNKNAQGYEIHVGGDDGPSDDVDKKSAS